MTSAETLDLNWIRATRLDRTDKGLPPSCVGLRQDEIGRQGWNVLRQDLPLPVAVLKASALDANRAWMRAFLAQTGARLAPHGKTTMCPEIFAMQLADGAFAITCATASQLEVYRAAGVKRILFANQLIGRANLHMALAHLREPDVHIDFIADSVEGATALAAAARELGLKRDISVLIELGHSGARTGARGAKAAIELARRVADIPGLRIGGVECYEAVVDAPDTAAKEALIAALLDELVEVAKAASALSPGADPFILTAGGSDFFDIVVERLQRAKLARPTVIVLRGGCYVTHDSIHYTKAFARLGERSPLARALPGALTPALEVWAAVQSRPEPQLAFCTVGKRDISFDFDPPKPILRFLPGRDAAPRPVPADWRTRRLNDQHLHLEGRDLDDLAIGELVAFGVSHPCTTLDKWRVLPVVADDYTVVDAFRTFF